MLVEHIRSFSASVCVIFILTILISCQSETQAPTDVKTIELKDFDTFISLEDDVLAVPSILKYEDSTLLVYDKSKGNILELNGNGKVVQKYGRKGRGPGEFLRVNNFFLRQDSLYVIDPMQYIIHRYDRNGEAITSLNYGQIMGLGSPNIPPAPFSTSNLRAKDINNQPFVTINGNLLVSSANFADSVQAIYELRDWNGHFMSRIGEIPEGSSFIIDYDRLESDVSNRRVPAFYRSNAFPVADRANPKEYFLIYSAFPKILKYNSNGRLLWEQEITKVTEIDSIRNDFYQTMEQMQQADPRNRINLKYYTSGVSSPEGDLYLITDSNPLGLHQFNPKGELIKRYKIISKDIDVLPIFDINFDERKIFILTNEGEIRIYDF